MKKFQVCLLLLVLTILVHAQPQPLYTGKPFRFAFLSDTHIGSPDGKAEEDLRRTVADINQMKDIAFVVITGDITELGTNEELRLAKKIFDLLKVPFYIIPGNHDSGWSESGGVMFKTVFGYENFSFEYEGIRFLGCPSGPYVRMSDGHIPRSSIRWLDEELKKNVKDDQPVIFLNHYPIDNGLDNWYEITDRFKNFNTWAILCGHGHANRAMNFEGIPGVMGRSNLRAKAQVGGYNLVDIKADTIFFTERRPGVETLKTWTYVKIEKHYYDKIKSTRPDYRVNDSFGFVTEKWRYAAAANVISTPVVFDDQVIFGDQDGKITSLSLKNGKERWTFKTGGSVFSSPAVSNGKIVFGSGDKKVYCLNAKNGKLKWSFETGAAVMGCPLIQGDTIYIGGSDHSFIALDLNSGKLHWRYNELQGPVVSTPVLYGNKIIFGAWDRNLYALNKFNGAAMWTWNNGSSVRNYSPAACIPVIKDDVVYVVAPDRYITAIDVNDGSTLWRNNDATVRESIGISENGKWIYGKTMQDTVVAYATSREKQSAAWKMNCQFGYEHVPSMLIEKDGQVFFGTRSGVVYSIDPLTRQRVWAHKIDNSMVNTVRVIDKQHVIASTMDGKVVLLEATEH